MMTSRKVCKAGCLWIILCLFACQHHKQRDIGIMLFQGGRYLDAIYYFNQALKSKPDFAEGFYYRGLAYCGLKDFKKALADFDQAVKLDNTMAEAYVNRGIILATQGQTGRALSDFNKALALNSRLAQAYTNRAGLYYKSGKYQQAETDFAEAIALDPDNPANFANRGDIRMRRGDLEGARSDLETALEKDDSPKNLLRLSRLSILLEDYPGAVKYADRATMKDSRNVEAFALWGEALYLQSRYNFAVLQFSRAIGYDPKLVEQRFPEAYYYRGIIYHQQKKSSLARDDLRHYLKIGENRDFLKHAEEMLDLNNSGI